MLREFSHPDSRKGTLILNPQPASEVASHPGPRMAGPPAAPLWLFGRCLPSTNETLARLKLQYNRAFARVPLKARCFVPWSIR